MSNHASFTTVSGRLAEIARPRRADLHVHTTASDGEFTPEQVVAFARRAGLAAVAITDHDTLAAVEEARAAAADHLELVAGVEITAAFAGREVHLLGYFVRTDHAPLNAALARLSERRRERFRDFLARLAARGFPIPEDRAKLVEVGAVSLGRRHVAGLLVACGHAHHRTEAFHRLLGSVAGQVLPKELIPVEEAIALVRAAGGASSLAHPSHDLTDADFSALAAFGLDALEVEYPWGRNSPAARLREAAARYGFAVTGGRDCHGPHPAGRGVGSHAITLAELEGLRERAGCADVASPRS
jgi:predicted metal-dependent phosphoesterase TrpH